MKKIAGILGALMILANSASAQIDAEGIALGGIVPGSNFQDVIAVYGQPWRLDEDEYIFGEGFRVKVSDENPNVVEKVVSTADNGIETPEGVKIGMKSSLIRSIYGKPDKIDRDAYDMKYIYRVQDKLLIFKFVNYTIVKMQVELDD